MSRFYVDIDGLRRRHREGEAICRKIEKDIAGLEKDMEELKACDAGRDESPDHAAHMKRLEKRLCDLKKTAGNITAVCEFDRCAIERYTALYRRIEDMADGIQL